MLFIKRFLFILFCSLLYCYFGYKLFYPIYISNSVIIPYGIHPFNICTELPDLWKYIKITFLVTYIFSSFIISNFLYFILLGFLQKLSYIIKSVWEKIGIVTFFFKIKKFFLFIFSEILHLPFKIFSFLRHSKSKNQFFSDSTTSQLQSGNGIKLNSNSPSLVEKNEKKFPQIFSKILQNESKTTSFRMFVGNKYNGNDSIYLPEKSLYQNILITGTIGTGKTSSAMYPFTKQLIEFDANSYKNKIGMLVLDVKGNYYRKIVDFAKNCGRENDVIVLELKGKYRYNPLHKPNLKASVLANRLKTVLLLFSPNNSESFWLDKVEQILTECIKLCRLYNNGYVTFEEIHKLISTENYYTEKIELLRNKFNNNEFSAEDIYHLISSLTFFQKEFLALDSRTLSILKSEITRITNVFVSDYDSYYTFNPPIEELNFFGFEDLINNGKIVVLNMNISEYKMLSKIIATYLKLDFQTEVMSRLAHNFETSNRSVAFISDEYHEYVTASDSEFYAQSREAKCINIVATQSYTSLLNTLNNKYAVEVIIQNLVNKFWFRTDDIYTIESAQKQMGKEDKEKTFKSISENAKETNYSYITNSLNSDNSSITESISTQITYDYIYDSHFFTQELENFCSLAFLSDGNKIMKPQKIKLKPYFSK